MESQILLLLEQVRSPENSTRSLAESRLSELFQAESSQTALLFINIAANAFNGQQFPMDMRQSCLLYLKTVVPVFWSAGFPSFTGPAISGEVKQTIRSALLHLIASDTDSKIRNSAIYCVVQIAAVDFPDEWPELLDSIYGVMLAGEDSTAISLAGGLQLLQDIFDDLITEELFFARGVGITTIQSCMTILTDKDQSMNSEIKNLAAKLYASCLTQLQNPEILEDETKLETLKPHFVEVSLLLQKLLTSSLSKFNHHDLELRTSLYSISSTLIEDFPQDLMPQDFIKNIHTLIINDLIQASQINVNVSVLDLSLESQTDKDVGLSEILKNLLIELYQLLTTISASMEIERESQYLNASLEYFGESILASSLLPLETENDYLGDFNVFVVDETGLSSEYSIRNAVFDYLTEANEVEFKPLKNWIWSKILTLDNDGEDIDWRSREALFYLFKCVSSSDLEFVDSDTTNTSNAVQVLNKLITALKSSTTENTQDQEVPENLAKARIIDIIPLFLKSFDAIIDVKQFGMNTLHELLVYIKSSSSNLLKSSLLNSITPYDTLLDFRSIKSQNSELGSALYNDIFLIVTQVLDCAADDTPSLLSDSLTNAFKLHEHSIEDLNLLIAIVSKDPANIQLIVEVEEALESLFDGISNAKYNEYLENLLPKLIMTIENDGLNKNGEYSTTLNLSLQILGIFLNFLPHVTSEDLIEPMKQQEFNIIFERISMLVSITSDDQILQICGEIYNSLLSNVKHTEWFSLEVVLKVLSKFFSPELSDSAVLNLGSLVVSVLARFGSSFSSSNHTSQTIPNEVLSEILEATSKRLLVAENISTIENFLNVLCFMLSIDVEQTLALLNGFGILEQILNIWFKNFDILKGHERIKLNCESLMGIYLFIGGYKFTGNDNSEVLEILKNLKVDGDELLNSHDKDVIITRSMRKTMKFEQVPVYLKIIKLLLGELNSQIVGNSSDAVHEEDLDHIRDDDDDDIDDVIEDEDGWEDLEEIGDDFDKLKSYIDMNDEDAHDKSDELKLLLINFFKKVASQNILNFKEIYENNLNEQDRQLLTENIV